MVALLREVDVPLCIDADGLGVLGRHLELLKTVRGPVVLTPHPKELSRLLGRTVSEVQRDRIELAKAFAIEHECVVVLKGARTVVASFSGAVSVIAAGNPGMATAGTGDVLAGVIGAMLAQGLGVFDAARVGALLHGCAGDIAASRFGQAGMSATDLVNSMGDVLTGWDR
jgi:NAD(P)H-hydrate epimerase